MRAVQEALSGGWLAPAGPQLQAFEKQLSEYVGVEHAVALASGTAALHLGLKALSVQPGDYVLVPCSTFAATAFAATYLGAEPAFVDVDESWNIDPAILEVALAQLNSTGRRVAAVIAVDLYGNPADYSRLQEVCDRWQVPLLEDAAEALGGHHQTGQKLGSFGGVAAVSFNGNKIITASAGGALLTESREIAERARYWASQARSAVSWYEHVEVGFNYRLSNVLAALGASQLSRIDSEVALRRQIRSWYQEEFSSMEDVVIQEGSLHGVGNAWLTVARVTTRSGPDHIISRLAQAGIEARHAWKPLHRQPAFARCRAFLNGQSDGLFAEGVCLPSGTALRRVDVKRIASIVKEAINH